MRDWRIIERAIGPGLVFSGSAIGISHLVHSTRAGATYGAALIGFILLVNVLKYPAFRFGLDYSMATGRSLIGGYRDLGRWVAIAFCLSTFPMQPIGMAAICVTTAAFVAALTGTSLPIAAIASVAIVASLILLLGGGYRWLDLANKVLVAFLATTTVITTVVILPRIDWATAVNFGWATDPVSLLFLVALAGFMPSPVSQSVALSMWALAAQDGHEEGRRPGLIDVRRGFTGAYILAAILAICFCLMGAGVMHAAETEPANGAAQFAAQIIDLYRAALGPGVATLAAIAALCVMATTMLAGFDGTARMWAAAAGELGRKDSQPVIQRDYTISLVCLALVTGAIVLFMMKTFTAFIDMVTTVFFLVSPVLALLNHIVITRSGVPEAAQPGRAMIALSLSGIVLMTALAILFFFAV